MFAVVVVCQRIDRRIPGALIALAGSVVLVSLTDLQHHGVAVLGHDRAGAPQFGLLACRARGREVAPVAATVALVVVTQSAATTRAFARQSGRDVDVGRDLLAVGAGNAVAGLVGAFPVNASPPRTAAAVGRRAHALARTAGGGGGAALIPAAGILKDVPLATLAGVLLFVAARLFHGGEIVAIARFDKLEFGARAHDAGDGRARRR